MTKPPQAGGWSAEMDQVLLSVIDQGGTASDAANAIGAQLQVRKSRNACIARALRIGHPFPPKVWRPKEEGGGLRVLAKGEARPEARDKRKTVNGKKVPLTPVERRGGPKKPALGNFNPISFNSIVAESKQTKEERRKIAEETRTELMVRMKEMAQIQPGVPFMERGRMECAAMFGTGMHANCCGKRVAFRPDGQLSSYCADHHRLYHSDYQPKSNARLVSIDRDVKVLPRPDDEAEEELVPVDQVLGDGEDDDQQQAA